MKSTLFSFEAITFYCLLIVIFGVFSHLLRRLHLLPGPKKLKLGYSLLLVLLMFVANFFSFKSLWLKDQSYNESEYWLLTAISGLIMWGVARYFVVPKTPSSHFKSKRGESLIAPANYKEVKDVWSWRVSVYPRISIYDIESGEDHTGELIFDSSDFDIINEAFGTIEGFQETLQPGKEFRFRDRIMLADDVQVDFMCLFDDYDHGWTRVHEGENTPYNIQIFVRGKFLNEEE